MSQPVGNIDTGGIIGSYIGLIFLSGIYVAAGVWSSAVTDNQIVAFLYGMVLSFLLFAGFDFIGEVGGLAEYQSFLLNLGINYHYEPMSRGVIALSDVVYFLSVILFFVWLTVRRFSFDALEVSVCFAFAGGVECGGRADLSAGRYY